MALGYAFAAAILDGTRLARPFAKPGVVVADLALEPQSDAVDLADFGAAPRRHVQADQKTVRPAIVIGKVSEGQLFLRSSHRRLRQLVIVTVSAASWRFRQRSMREIARPP